MCPDAGFYGLWDTNKYEWSSKILGLLEIDKKLLPQPMPSGTKAGVISKYVSEKSGFAEGMPICVGAGDQNSAAVGAGIVYDGFASVSMGTAGNANAYLDSRFRDPSEKSMIVNHAIYGKWEIEGHQAGAAGVFRWFRDEIGTLEKFQAEENNQNVYKILDELIAKTLQEHRVLFFFHIWQAQQHQDGILMPEAYLQVLLFHMTEDVLQGLFLKELLLR